MKRRIFLRQALSSMAFLPLFNERLAWSLATQSDFVLQGLSKETIHDRKLNIEIPNGCTARIIGRSTEQVVKGSDYLWHAAPDGGACFETDDGGWIYVSNSELPERKGGVGAIRFDSSGEVVDAYSILSGTSRNCAGGKTPWGSWLSCEENGDLGQVYECDPEGKKKAEVHPAMGSFNHESVVYDPGTGYFYLTEDVHDGCFYRFLPTKQGRLDRGRLEVAVADDRRLSWRLISDPEARRTPCRYQINQVARFKGGEGITYSNGHIYFTTKIDNRVWQYNTKTNHIAIVYDVKTSHHPILSGVDDIVIAPSGELMVAEDGGDMQLVGLGEDFQPFQLVKVFGQSRSEITGPAFNPEGTRLYFSSQRGKTGKHSGGITYEITLPEAIQFL